MSADVKTFPPRRFARLHLAPPPAPAPDNLIVMPVIRRDEACTAIAVPSYAEQAAAVRELATVVTGLLPKLPLISLADADMLLRRLEAAAATLRRLADNGAGT